MKSDRKLTLEEVLSGNVSEEYLDNKEKMAVISRHITRLANKRFDLEDKMELVGERDDLVKEYKKLTDKIVKLKDELSELEAKYNVN